MATAQAKLTSVQWRFLFLLLASVAINYIDRGNLSVAAPPLSSELHLSPAQLGILLSSFFWTYALFQVPAGWAVDRFDVSLVYGLGFFLWSLATALTGWVDSFSNLFALRLLLGFGEAAAFPAYSKIIANHVPETRRGLANAMVDVGDQGPARPWGLSSADCWWPSLAGGALFLGLGFGAMIWLPPWILWAPRNKHRVVVQLEAPSIVEILRQRSAWGTFIGLFSGNYAWYFMLTWAAVLSGPRAAFLARVDGHARVGSVLGDRAFLDHDGLALRPLDRPRREPEHPQVHHRHRPCWAAP